MIKILGTRRLIIIAVLAGLNVFFAAVVYSFMIPGNVSLQAQLNDVSGQVTASRAETERMRTEFDTIQRQKAQFEQLQATDFFTVQDRVQARDRFEAMQKFSRVLQAGYDIKAAVVEKTDELTEAGQVMLVTPVDVSVDAVDDLDFYQFVYLIENGFPGFAGINRIEVQRIRDLDDVSLREIGSGVPTTLIQGKISFTWKTIVPQNKVSDTLGSQAGL